MNSPSKFPKSLFVALVFALVVIAAVKFCLPVENKTAEKLINKPFKQAKKQSTDQVITNPRSVASTGNIQNKKIIYPASSPSLELVKEKYFSFLPEHIKWSVIPVGTSNKGEQIKIRLEDSISGKKTSYHALVEPTSGKILTTWHRQIQH